MIYPELFLGFLKVGLFAFGGAYGAIPLIRDVVLSYGWLTDDALSYMIAVSESTPGPIMVNLATYVGSSQAGVLGALLATFAVVLPSFVIILLVTAGLKKLLKKPWMQAILSCVKPCVVGIVLAMGAYLILGNAFDIENGGSFEIKAAAVTIVLLLFTYLPRLIFKKKLSPIYTILLAAVLGMAIA
ncbi:MAG: chromate transporter [Clostridia bacterium]|nr:chromate transporter [Clostridia bacterium]